MKKIKFEITNKENKIQYTLTLNETDIIALRGYLKDLIFLYKKKLKGLEYEFMNSKFHELEIDFDEIEYLKSEIPQAENLYAKIFYQTPIKRS